MKKRTLKVQMIEAPTETLIDLDLRSIELLALEMTLLQQGLCTELVLFHDSVRIRLRPGDEIQSKARGTRNPSGVDWSLGVNQIEFVQTFLLKTFRDEMAAVNHFHIEGLLEQEHFDLTFMFTCFAPPRDGRGFLDYVDD